MASRIHSLPGLIAPFLGLLRLMQATYLQVLRMIRIGVGMEASLFLGIYSRRFQNSTTSSEQMLLRYTPSPARALTQQMAANFLVRDSLAVGRVVLQSIWHHSWTTSPWQMTSSGLKYILSQRSMCIWYIISRRNNFQFLDEFRDNNRCPWAAHIRRSNPRADTRLQPLDNRRIMRRGISFGPEVTQEEQTSGTTQQGRGLLFACYQASIEDAFQFIQKSGYLNIFLQQSDIQAVQIGVITENSRSSLEMSLLGSHLGK